MRIFTVDPKTAQQDTSARSALPGPTRVGESHAADAANPGVARFGYDFGRIAVHGDPVVRAAEHGTRGVGAPYPFRAQIQSGFGRHDIGHVRAHTGSRAAAAARAIGARAFAYGDQVAFDGAPDLHTAAHEAAHVVQQRAGVQLKDDQGRPGDAFERHADAVADRIVGRQSAEALLDTEASGSRAAAVQRRVVQRKETTKYGDFDTDKYDDLGGVGSEVGVDIELTFEPGANVDATKIGLTQSVRSALAGGAVAIDPAMQKRMVPAGTGEGRQIDRATSGAYANPLYAAKAPGARDKLGSTPTVAGWGQHGWHYTDRAGPHHQKAILKDAPSLGGPSNSSEQVFETAALAVGGKQNGTYMGSVEWGWRINAAGKFKKLPVKKISDGVPSAEFMAAAKQWNKWTTRGTIKTTPDPTQVYDAAYSPAFKVDKNTTVDITDTFVHADEIYNGVTILSGKETGNPGRIKTTEMHDAGGGRASIDLPIQRTSTIKAAAAGGLVNLRSAAGAVSPLRATLADGTPITVRNETRAWIEIEVDTTQAGVTLSGGVAADIAGMVRGFISRELVH